MLLYPQASTEEKKILYRCYKGYCQGCGAFRRKKVLIEVMRLNIKTNQETGIKSMDESLMRILQTF
jgi:hypothetical protein